MSTLRNKKILAALSRKTPEKARNSHSQNLLDPGMAQENISQVSKEIPGRDTNKHSKGLSQMESRILGAMSKLDEVLLKPPTNTLGNTKFYNNTHTHTHTFPHTHTHLHTYTNTHTLTLKHTYTSCTHRKINRESTLRNTSPAPTEPHAHRHTKTQIHTQTYAHAGTHSLSHTHANTHTNNHNHRETHAHRYIQFYTLVAICLKLNDELMCLTASLILNAE